MKGTFAPLTVIPKKYINIICWIIFIIFFSNLGIILAIFDALNKGTFVTHLVDLYSKNPENDDLYLKRGRELIDDLRLPLRKYFIKEREDVMYKIIRNYFNAIGKVFNKEWNDYKKYILCKSTGYEALIKVFPYLYQLGEANGSLEEEFFRKKFELLKLNLEKSNIELNSQMFPYSAAQQAKLSNIMITCMEKGYDYL
ncbi:hypothetical protein H8J79_05220 [Clostridium perfringens]|uniref:hypothetical protein n=1 Tax=Clostridium perfringens TaxID=1502 RepID=UPI0018E3FB72|nr:hypothetical protein [Clostridium perfringens]MBI6020217.1 hypothetical protein [Clostridium perfringens]